LQHKFMVEQRTHKPWVTRSIRVTATKTHIVRAPAL
jgi:hypothetical protein